MYVGAPATVSQPVTMVGGLDGAAPVHDGIAVTFYVWSIFSRGDVVHRAVQW